MRLSVLLSAVVLSFLFLMPQKGYSQQILGPVGSPPAMPDNAQVGMGTPPESEQLLHAQREYERMAFYLADLQQLLDAAKARGDKEEVRRLRGEIKGLQQSFKAAKKAYKKAEERVAIGRQFDFLCATNQNPGSCRRCENGRVVIDDSQNPGKCMKCSDGQVVYDNSFISSCKRCLNGHVTDLNGTICKPPTDCMEYTCQQGKCIGNPLFTVSPCSKLQCCLAAK